MFGIDFFAPKELLYFNNKAFFTHTYLQGQHTYVEKKAELLYK